jgi:hypothetical protein
MDKNVISGAGKPYCERVEIFGTGVLCEYD